MKKDIFIWTHYDFDGAVSYLIIKWLYPGINITYKTTDNMNFREDFLKWSLSNSNSYKYVFILDIDVSKDVDLLNDEKFVIIDHHETNNPKKYNNCITYIKPYKSNALLMYNFYTKKGRTFTEEQKKLIIYATDYDNYDLKYIESRILNNIMWTYKFEYFIEKFKNGFEGLDKKYIISYKNFLQIFKKYLNGLEFFRNSNLLLGKRRYDCIATFSDCYVNDTSDYIFNKYNCDVVLIININKKSVYIRGNRFNKINVLPIATKICNGGGHKFSCGGKLTDELLEIIKELKPI